MKRLEQRVVTTLPDGTEQKGEWTESSLTTEHLFPPGTDREPLKRLLAAEDSIAAIENSKDKKTEYRARRLPPEDALYLFDGGLERSRIHISYLMRYSDDSQFQSMLADAMHHIGKAKGTLLQVTELLTQGAIVLTSDTEWPVDSTETQPANE